ncbi:hypothetical protein D9619_002720 [Psilocybe cf. subviscida]|uniref:Methyltransferase domain-containing protein n=1 Tax=Psilocybe cf. subviscida TaxID=2480587 RepID=A0A8H5AWS5_9AGAR|nr:hypothetical protein D9619_002720 [Psilocybe cf. subviscida]
MDFDSDTDTEYGSVAPTSIFGSTASAGDSMTSYEVDRSASPDSVRSMTSSQHAAAYRLEYGREINNHSDMYRLPADDEEMNRLSSQHGMFIDLMGGKYVPPMAEVMAEEEGETKAVLDLGCGSGSWIIDVARDFSHCDARAVDLIPMQPPDDVPNIRSEVDDINLGLEHFYGDFNVVHVRLISSGIRDYHLLVDQISRVLRPGGLLDIAEFDFHLYDGHHRRIQNDSQNLRAPWWAQWCTLMREAIQNIGGDTDAAAHLHEWILENPRFEDVVYREYWLPVVPPPIGENYPDALRRFEEKVRKDVTSFLSSGRPLLLGSGISEDVVDQMSAECMVELDERRYTQYTRLQCVYARKIRTPLNSSGVDPTDDISAA